MQWFDVDQPNVIALRRKLYDERDGYRMIGSSVTDEVWLDEIPTDRPMLMVAEGLLMYLTEPEVRTLLQRLTDRFGSGELVFDTVSPMGPRLSKMLTKGITKWGIRDARDIEQWNPRLRFLEQSFAGHSTAHPLGAGAAAVAADLRHTGPQLRRAQPLRVLKKKGPSISGLGDVNAQRRVRFGPLRP